MALLHIAYERLLSADPQREHARALLHARPPARPRALRGQVVRPRGDAAQGRAHALDRAERDRQRRARAPARRRLHDPRQHPGRVHGLRAREALDGEGRRKRLRTVRPHRRARDADATGHRQPRASSSTTSTPLRGSARERTPCPSCSARSSSAERRMNPIPLFRRASATRSSRRSAPSTRSADPAVHRSNFADYQADAALRLAKPLKQEAARHRQSDRRKARPFGARATTRRASPSRRPAS